MKHSSIRSGIPQVEFLKLIFDVFEFYLVWWLVVSCDGSVSVSSSPGPRVCEDRWHEDRSGGYGHRWHAGALRSVSPQLRYSRLT